MAKQTSDDEDEEAKSEIDEEVDRLMQASQHSGFAELYKFNESCSSKRSRAQHHARKRSQHTKSTKPGYSNTQDVKNIEHPRINQTVIQQATAKHRGATLKG